MQFDKFKRITALRVIHDLGDADRHGTVAYLKRGRGEGAPLTAVQGAGLDLCAPGERDAAGPVVFAGSAGDRVGKAHARVGAVCRVVYVPLRGG